MAKKTAQKRRRDYVQRQNPKFFIVGTGKQQPTREAVDAEYDRLVKVSQYDRNPETGKERPPGADVAFTPPLKPTRGVNDLAQAVDNFLNPNSHPDLAVDAENVNNEVSRPGDQLTARSGNIDQAGFNTGGVSTTHTEVNTLEQIDWATDAINSSKDASNMMQSSSTTHGNDSKPNYASTEGDQWCLDGSGQAALEPSSNIGFNQPGAGFAKPNSDIWAEDNPIAPAQSGDWGVATNDFGKSCAGDMGTGADPGDSSWKTIDSTRGRRHKTDFSAETPSSGQGCFNCGKDGHRKADCPEPPKPRGGACYKCGEQGHMSRECPNPSSGGGSGGDTRTCYKCNQAGHISRDCPEGGGASSGNRGCFNCGEHGHRAADCPTGGGGGDYKGSTGRGGGSRTCHKCGQAGHIARDCSGDSGGFDSGGFDNGGFDNGGFDTTANSNENNPEFGANGTTTDATTGIGDYGEW